MLKVFVVLFSDHLRKLFSLDRQKLSALNPQDRDIRLYGVFGKNSIDDPFDYFSTLDSAMIFSAI